MTGVTLAIHSAVDAGFVGEGLGARLHYEVAGGLGQLAWQRGEARVVLRESYGRFMTLARVDAGIVNGAVIPPQQMFEIGLVEGLLAYNYKQFGGDRAAIWRAEELYNLPFWRAPLRLAGFVLPSPSPSVDIGFQSGWAETATTAGKLALVELGSRVNPATNQVLRDLPGSRSRSRVRPTGSGPHSTFSFASSAAPSAPAPPTPSTPARIGKASS